MKRGLLATTALAAGLTFTASGIANTASAQSAKPSLTLSGSSEQEFGYAENDGRLGRVGFDQHSDGEVHFNFKTTLDNGLKISGRIELEGNTSSDQIDEHFMRITGSFGQITLGSDDNVANGFSIEPPQEGIGIADIDKWVHEQNVDGFLNQDYDNASEDSEKVSYVTPSFAGFKAGISYIPAWDQDSNSSPASQTAQYSSGWAFGLNYEGKMGGVSIEAGVNHLTFTDGPSAAMAIGDPRSTNAGVKLGFGGFSIGVTGGWVDDMRQGTGSDSELEDGTMYEIGVGYGQGPWGVALTYHHGEVDGLTSDPDKDESDLILLAASYKLGPGVTVHGNVFHADWQGEASDSDTATTADGNDGTGAVVGIKVSF